MDSSVLILFKSLKIDTISSQLCNSICVKLFRGYSDAVDKFVTWSILRYFKWSRFSNRNYSRLHILRLIDIIDVVHGGKYSLWTTRL